MFFSKMSIFSINLFKKSEIERQILASIQFAQSVMKFKNSKLKKKEKKKEIYLPVLKHSWNSAHS